MPTWDSTKFLEEVYHTKIAKVQCSVCGNVQNANAISLASSVYDFTRRAVRTFCCSCGRYQWFTEPAKPLFDESEWRT